MRMLPRPRFRGGAKVKPRVAPVKVTKADGTVYWIPGDTRTYAQRRDASKNNRYRVTHAMKERIRQRDKVCKKCGTDKGPFHVDHIRPYSKGGWNVESNLQLLCAPCNIRKGATWSPRSLG